jgi:hypothetical protein
LYVVETTQKKNRNNCRFVRSFETVTVRLKPLQFATPVISTACILQSSLDLIFTTEIMDGLAGTSKRTDSVFGEFSWFVLVLFILTYL